jgi:DNA-binding SARP family transcriptional activator
MLELRTLGHTAILRDDGTQIGGVIAQRRSLSVLALLAVAGDAGLRRDAILALLWPDADGSKGRHALTQSLYQMRRAVGCDDLFIASGDNVRLNAERISCDASRFIAAAERKDDEEALREYRGPFLEGFALPSAVEFEQWTVAQRERFKALFSRVLDRCATAAESCADWSSAVRHLTQLLALDRHNASTTLRLMHAMLAGGDRAGAIRQGSLHGTLLRAELDIEPNDEIEQFVEELRATSGEGIRPVVERARAVRTPTELNDRISVPRDAAAGRHNHERRRLALRLGLLTLAACIPFGAIIMTGPDKAATLPIAGQSVIVAPFRVSGSDSSLRYLREGIVELLSDRLGEDSAARAIDPGRVLSAWHREKLNGAADTPHPVAIRIARELGASRVVVGGVVGNGSRFVVSASLIAAADGRVRARAQVEGSPDSITSVVNRLAAKLMATEAGEGDRFSDRSVPSLAALREFLEGQVAYFRGDFGAAIPAYERALAKDSTFALAALQLALAADHLNSAEQHDRALAIAWAYRRDLNERDLAHLIAFAGPRYPAASLESEQVDAWERAVNVAPDRAEVWFELGERLFRSGGVVGLVNPHARAVVALTNALTLDPTHARARRLLIILSARTGDLATLKRIATPAALRDSVGELSAFLRWRVAIALGDSSELRTVRKMMGTLDDQSLRAIAMSSLNDAIGVLDGERAARITMARSRQQTAWYDATIEQHSLALNKGRPALALELTTQLAARQPGSHAHLRLRVLDRLYAEGDSAAASAAADSLALDSDSPFDGDPTQLAVRLADACVLEQWRLSQGVTKYALHTMRRLQTAELPRQLIPLSANQLTCARILDAWHAVVTHRRDAVNRVATLDSLALVGPATSDASTYANILVGRLYLALGNPRAALTAFRRRSYMTGWPRYLATVRREEAQVVTSLGDTAIARASFARYLLLRRRPEPSLVAAVQLVRKQARELLAHQADVDKDLR